MAIHVSKVVEVSATPKEVLELVLDLEAYRGVDPKIRKVRAGPVLNDGRGTAKIVGSLWRFPPAPDTHLVHLEPWRTLTFEGKPLVLARSLYSFTGRFEVLRADGRTRLRHGYTIAFRPPLRPFEARVRAWLDDELEEEMVRIAQHFRR